MDWNRIRDMFTDENYHDFVLKSFVLGKHTIISGSIILLTILGVITWIFGAFGLIFLVYDSIAKWVSSGTTASALQGLQTNVIQLLDLFLLSVVLLIVAIGLYGIFLKKDIKLPVKITEMSELERYLFGTIVAILLVYALNRIFNSTKETLESDIIIVGMICGTVVAISVYLAVQRSKEPSE